MFVPARFKRAVLILLATAFYLGQPTVVCWVHFCGLVDMRMLFIFGDGAIYAVGDFSF